MKTRFKIFERFIRWWTFRKEITSSLEGLRFNSLKDHYDLKKQVNLNATQGNANNKIIGEAIQEMLLRIDELEKKLNSK